jgi:signal transduction histidine kinase
VPDSRATVNSLRETGITRLTFDVRDVDEARHARGVLVAILAKRGFPPIKKLNAELVFGELIGNVLRHANTGAEVAISIDCTDTQPSTCWTTG